MLRFGIRRAFAGVAAIALAAAGCGPSGPSYAEVSGKVSYKGAPVTLGTVYFKLEGTEYSGSAPIRADGTYSSKSVPVGKCKVLVQTAQHNPKPSDARSPVSSGPPGKGSSSKGPSGSGGPSGSSGGPPRSGPPGGTAKVPDWVAKTNPNEPAPGKFVATPPKYELDTTSTLEFEVKSGSNTYEIDLKD